MTDKTKSDNLNWLPNMAIGAESEDDDEPLDDDPEADPDDEKWAVTPPDVIVMLGFDPLDIDEDEEV